MAQRLVGMLLVCLGTLAGCGGPSDTGPAKESDTPAVNEAEVLKQKEESLKNMPPEMRDKMKAQMDAESKSSATPQAEKK